MATPQHIVAVSALVKNDEGQVLMVLSPRRGWEFPGGQVEEGENLMEATQREVLEESGVTVTVGNLVGIYSNIKPPPKVMFGFLAEYRHGELRTSDESIETAWVNPEDVLNKITHPAIRDRMQDMLTFNGQIVYRVYTNAPYQILEERVL